MRARVALVVVAMTAAACGGGDVSQEVYDQKVAELALAQQDLLEARQDLQVAGASQQSLDELASRYEDAVLEALALRAMTVPDGFDRVEVLAEAVAGTVQERDELLSMVEGGTEQSAPGQVDQERLGILLTMATSALLWLSPQLLPDEATIRETLGSLVERVNDEMISLAYGDLLSGYAEGVGDERKAELISNVGYWALEMAQSALAG